MSSSARPLHLSPPFRAEHVGSLLRPTALFKRCQLFEDNKCTIEELRGTQDEAIKRAVEMQKEVGMKTITDGEMRRYIILYSRLDRGQCC
jgi:methionine synthase II (cobalamin-independent)